MANLEFCDTHNMVAYLHKIEGSEGFHQIVNFLNISHIKYALTENPTIHVSLSQQFWQTAAVNTLDSREVQITATIDGKVKLVSEESIRRHLKLEDSDGITTLPNTKIFKQLTLMGSNSAGIPTRHETEVPQPNSSTYTNVADEVAFTSVDVVHGGATTTVSSIDAGQGSGNIPKSLTMPYDSPLSGGHTPGSDEGRPNINELMDICTNLSNRENVSKHGRKSDKTKPMFKDSDFDVLDDAMENVEGGSTAEQITTVRDTLNTTSINVSAAGPSTSTIRDIFEDEMTTIADTLVAIRSERPRTTLVVIRNVEEEPMRATPVPTVQSQDKEQEAKDAALIEQMEDVQARMDVDELLAARL
ncbi:hypothetical protein Tco_1540965 [Tanacetum coccineum]